MDDRGCHRDVCAPRNLNGKQSDWRRIDYQVAYWFDMIQTRDGCRGPCASRDQSLQAACHVQTSSQMVGPGWRRRHLQGCENRQRGRGVNDMTWNEVEDYASHGHDVIIDASGVTEVEDTYRHSQPLLPIADCASLPSLAALDTHGASL